MASNEFENLLDDLAVVQRLKDAGALNKALDMTSLRELEDLRRRVAAQETPPVPHGPAIFELGALRKALPAGSSQPRRPTTKAEARAKVRAAVPELLHKALTLQAAGEMTGEQVSQLEARLHHMMEAVR